MSKKYNGIPSIEHIQEVTDFKKKSHAIAALDTLFWIENQAYFDNFKFNLEIELNFGECRLGGGAKEKDFCGTVGCIAGGIYFFKQKNNKKKIDYYGFNIFEEFGNKIKNFWGDPDYELSPELRELFFGDNGVADLGDVTSEDAAKVLLKYLWTGKVKWPEKYLTSKNSKSCSFED
jgi:hypothetical protein